MSVGGVVDEVVAMGTILDTPPSCPRQSHDHLVPLSHLSVCTQRPLVDWLLGFYIWQYISVI